MNLRDYQADALRRAIDLFGSGADGVVVVAPTGTGKTTIGSAWARASPGKTLWVAPRRELLHQASNALRALGLEPEIDVFVRSNQELTVKGARVPLVERVVWDECHHGASDTWSLIRQALPFARWLGFTATPERGDGRGLRGIFDELIEAISIPDAIADGWLVPADVLAPDHALAPGELAEDPVDAWFKHAEGLSTVLFAPTVQLAVQYACWFRERGVDVATITGDMKPDVRDDQLAAYAEGRVRVLCNVNVLTEGWDAPRTECVVLARGFGTTGSYLQAVGRGLRPFDGKTRCLLLDLRGNVHVHGAPEEVRAYSLDGKAIRRAGDEPDVRFCPVCGGVVANVSPMQCEECGHSGEMRLRPPRVLGLPIVRFAKKRLEDADARAKTFAKWLGECRAKGWKDGRAAHRYKAVYGGWPEREVQQAAMKILGVG